MCILLLWRRRGKDGKIAQRGKRETIVGDRMSGLRQYGLVLMLGVIGAFALHVYTRQAMAPASVADYLTQSLPRQLAEFWRPGAGEWVLAKPVQQALDLLRRHGAESYRISPGFAADLAYPQRLMEGGWPIRQENAAPWYVALTGEDVPPGCSLVERQEDALLAHCPQP